ncbi:RNA-binding protein NOB1 isoform X2 [Stigmatopora argus]
MASPAKMAQPRLEHVVADAGAFLHRAPLQEIGKNVYTLSEVVEEIRDKATRRSLSFLPYQLVLRQPRPEHVRRVTEFSKKTGDYASLSSTDIKVAALTLQLEEEHVGSDHLRREPLRQVHVSSTRRHPETPVDIAGFHFPSERGPPEPPESRQLDSGHDDDEDDSFNSFQFWRQVLPSVEDELSAFLVSEERREAPTPDDFNGFQFWRQTPAPVDRHLLALLDEGSQEYRETEDGGRETEDSDDDDGGGGWITPANIGRVKADSCDRTTAQRVEVGCLTTDFAMQNVLMQMGLRVVSVNGMLIKEVRNFILRCHACFTTTGDTSKEFCPKCGNATLKKVSVSVDQDGQLRMHFSNNPKVLNPRGLRHTLPAPRGGKHSREPRLCEDQRFPQQRQSRKGRQKTDARHPDYAAGGASPFCPNDVYSRAAALKVRDTGCGAGRRRTNPNATRAKYTK